MTNVRENADSRWAKLPKPSRELLTRKRQRDRRKPLSGQLTLDELLWSLSIRNLRVIAQQHGIILGVYRKEDIIALVRTHLTSPGNLKGYIERLEATEARLLRDVIASGGVIDYQTIVSRYGPEERDSPYWFLIPPASTLGKLRSQGLVFVGEIMGKPWLTIVVVVPAELMDILGDIARHPDRAGQASDT